MTDVLEATAFAIFLYFVVYNICTLALLAASLLDTSRRMRARQPGRREARPPGHRPGVSIIVPTYNEEAIVVLTTSSLLEQQYDPLEVVIVDDGSIDETFERLDRAFELVPLPVGGSLPLESKPLRELYVSRKDPRLRVARKENGGRADALNLGISLARHDIVAVTDADGLLDPDAIASALEPFVEYPDDCVASGGTVRIVDGSRITEDRVVQPGVSWSGMGATQTLEYLRGFLGVRIAWSRLNGLLIVSGAFGVFRRDTLTDVGGFLPGSLGEDMELTIRMHHELRPNWPTARVAYAPDAVCWTQAPDTVRGLRSQRVRWQVGLLETIWEHRGMLARRRYGAAGTVAMPYVTIFEALSPLVEVFGYAVIAGLLILDLNSWPFVVAIVAVSIVLGQAQSIVALLIEESGFRLYSRAEMTRLIGWGLLEIFWFRPLIAFLRAWATITLFVGHRPAWGSIPRRTFDEEPAEAVIPLTR